MTDHEHTFCPHCKPCRLAPRMVEAEDALRSLAAYLGNGGYNDPRTGSDFDVKLFEMKIRDGIDAAMRLPKPVDDARVERSPGAPNVREWKRATADTLVIRFAAAITDEQMRAFPRALVAACAPNECPEVGCRDGRIETTGPDGEVIFSEPCPACASNVLRPDDTRDAARYRWVRGALDDITGDEAGIQGIAYSFQVPLAMIEKATAAELLDAVADAAIVMDDQEPMRGRDAP